MLDDEDDDSSVILKCKSADVAEPVKTKPAGEYSIIKVYNV